VSADSSTRTLPTGIQVTTQAVPADAAIGARGGGGGNGRIGADGTFQLAGLFGPRLLRVGGLGQTWMLDAVRADGRDVTDTPIDFGTAGGAAGVEVVITNRVTEVNGVVQAREGATRDYSVVIFPDDERKWTFPSRHVRSARPDQEGTFRIRALPAGERYLAVALDYVEDGEATDAAFLTQIKPRGTAFTLSAGETRSIELPLIER
jgi:hypothetical protein